MRSLHVASNPSLTTVALAIGVILASSVHAQTLNICQSKKNLCVAKKEAALLKCHFKAENAGRAVDPLCLQKAQNKFDGGAVPAKGCFAKLEATGICLTTGDTAALEAKVDAFVLDAVTGLDPGYPAPVLNKCSAGKKLCVANKAKALLECHAKAERIGSLDPACIEKAKDKFDGGFVPGCFARLEAKGNCLTLGDSAVFETKVDTFVNHVACELDAASPACAICPSESTYEFTANGDATDSDFGWTGFAHDNHLTSNVRFSLAIGGCTNPSTPCGQCSVSGPIANAGPAFQYQRCQGDSGGDNGSWIHCTTDADCAGTDNACVFYTGPPQPSSASSFPLCSLYDFVGPITGTVNVDTGDAAMLATIRQRLFEGLLVTDPCPICTGGTCSGGQRSGQLCTVDGHSTLFADDVSLDCPPDSAHSLGVGGVMMTTTLGTAPQAFTLSAASPSCRAPGFGSDKCLCDTCDNAAATLCQSNADCTAVGASICGGLRCTGGANQGTPCNADSECPASECAVPGAHTKPNQCDDNVCTPNSPPDTDSTNEGVCATGPLEQFCAIQTYRGCVTNGDCPLSGDTCSLTRFRECFTDNGTIGGGFSVAGVASTTAPTLGALTCIPPTMSPFLNSTYGLPGAGRFTIPGTAVIN